MVLLVVLAIAVVIAFLLGGRLHHLARVRLVWTHLILGALLLQLLIFSPTWRAWLGAAAYWSAGMYLVSLALLAVGVWVNRRVSGMVLLGLGLAMNSLVIFANGGHMPASLAALRLAGLVEPTASFETLRATNSSLVLPTTPLWFLGDVFAIPRQVPLANVFSVGDICIGLGAVWFVLANTQGADEI